MRFAGPGAQVLFALSPGTRPPSEVEEQQCGFELLFTGTLEKGGETHFFPFWCSFIYFTFWFSRRQGTLVDALY
jgi:hypothetical protein